MQELALADRQRKEREERVKQLQDWKARKQAAEALEQEEELRRSEAQAQARLQRAAFLKQQRDKVASLSALKRSEKESRLQQEAEAAQNYFAERAKAQQKVKSMLEQQKKKQEAQRSQQIDIPAFCAREDVQTLLGEFNSTLDVLFVFYAKVGAKDPLNANSVSVAGLSRLCQDFRILPALISAQDLVKLFRLSTKGQTQELDFPTFREWLIRVGLHDQRVLAQISGRELESTGTAETLRALFSFMGLTAEGRLTAELLKKLSSEPALHPLARKQLLRHAN